MKNHDEFKQEVLRRSQVRIKKQKTRRAVILSCLPVLALAVALTVLPGINSKNLEAMDFAKDYDEALQEISSEITVPDSDAENPPLQLQNEETILAIEAILDTVSPETQKISEPTILRSPLYRFTWEGKQGVYVIYPEILYVSATNSWVQLTREQYDGLLALLEKAGGNQ